MDSVLRERQDDDPEANSCSSTPVTGSASSHKPIATQRVLLEEETTDASNETSPPRLETASATASPNSTTSVTSSSISIPPQSSTSTASRSKSSSLPSQPQELLPNSNASNPETSLSVVSNSSAFSTSSVVVSGSSTTSTKSQAEASSPSTVAFSSSSTPTTTQQEKTTHASSLGLPGLAAIAPTESSKNVDIEAVPATSAPTTVGSAAAAPALDTTPAAQEESPSPPPSTSSATDAVSRDSTIKSDSLKPQPTGSGSLSSELSDLTTRTTSSPSLTNVPSTSSPVIESTAMPTMSAGAGSSVANNGNLPLQSSSSSSGPPTGMIVGGVIGGAAALGVIALLLWLWKRRSQKKKQIGQPLTPLSYGPGNTPSEEVMGRFAAGRQPWRRLKNLTQGWWVSNGVGHSSPFTRWDNDEKRGETVPLQQPISVHTRHASLGRRASLDPFSDAHSTDVVGNAITRQHHQHHQHLPRGILKQPAASASHSRRPSESAPFIATGMARRSRAHSISGQRAAPANSDAPPRIPASRRTSSLTIDPFEDRRNKFRSDPFDLEIDTRMLSTTTPAGSSAIFVTPGSSSNTDPMQQPRDPRASSVYSSGSGSSASRYTSGVANGGNWGESGQAPVAGLTVAPLALGGNRRGATDSPTLPQAAKKDGPPNAMVGQAF